MEINNKIVEIIFTCIDELNETRPSAIPINKNLDTVLYGKDWSLDSLELVTLIVSIEQKVFDDLGFSLTLADDKAVSQFKSPFKSVTTLCNYIDFLIGGINE